MLKKLMLNNLISMLTIVSIISGGILYAEVTYNQKSEVVQLAMDVSALKKKLKREDLEHEIKMIDTRMWRYEEKFGEELKKASDFIKEQYKELRSKKEKILRDLKNINSKEVE